MMQDSYMVPSLLHLGCVWAGQVCELGLTLRYPQIQFGVQTGARLEVSGACADVAMSTLDQLIAKHHRPLSASIEIEHAIPMHMGLGSAVMMAEAMRRLYQATHSVAESFRMPLSRYAARQGGLLLVDDEGVLKQHRNLIQRDDDEQWVFVFVLPDAPDDLAQDYEAQQAALLRKGVRPADSSPAVSALFAAAEQNDFAAFVANLATIHDANEAVLNRNLVPQTHAVLDLMRQHGAAHCGQMLTGLGQYALVRGGPASRHLRTVLQDHFDTIPSTPIAMAPIVMAGVCENSRESA